MLVMVMMTNDGGMGIGFFKSDKWTKTVGTVGALANWTLPMAAFAHISSGNDPATTISIPMTSGNALHTSLLMSQRPSLRACSSPS
jgi:hypothetical protein